MTLQQEFKLTYKLAIALLVHRVSLPSPLPLPDPVHAGYIMVEGETGPPV